MPPNYPLYMRFSRLARQIYLDYTDQVEPYGLDEAWLDVTGIVDKDCNTVVQYNYDAWGKLLSTAGSLASTIGSINPFRYRGYCYDNETGLFYVGSRYYDPETCRFINADWQITAGSDLTGANVFAYCGNNPVNRADPTGRSWGDIWNFAKEAVNQIGQAFKSTAKVYAGMGAGTFADGPLPFADTAMLIGAAVLTVGVIGYGTYQAAKSISIPKATAKAKTKDVSPPKNKAPVVFPANPANFNPVGLVPKTYPGTKNGVTIKWFSPAGVDVFEWNENPNGSAGNGPHYHIRASGDVHFYAGETVPEPYATIYFGGE